MAKEWILNQANMRWGLTRKSKVGPVAELIRKCAPKTLNEWGKFYLDKAYSKQHLEQLGKTLFIKISKKYIGLQIKPAGFEYITQIINEREQQKKNARKIYRKIWRKGVLYYFNNRR